jgi:hypothetical protein
MKRKIVIVLSMCCCLSLCAQTNSESAASKPFNFTYGKIPFGKTPDEVLKLVQGATVKEEENASISFAKDYGLSSYFEDGIYSIMSLGAYLNSKLSKQYTITYEGWTELKEITLYFVRSFEKDDYTLIMVKKIQKSSEGSYQNVYAGFKATICKGLGLKPAEEYTVKYQDDYMRGARTYEQGLAGYWKTKDQSIFLLIRNNWFSSGDPEMVYISTAGWGKYITSCKKYEDDKKIKQQEKSKAEF